MLLLKEMFANETGFTRDTRMIVRGIRDERKNEKGREKREEDRDSETSCCVSVRTISA